MRKILSLLMLFCMFVGTAWAQELVPDQAYYLKVKDAELYIDIKNGVDETSGQTITIQEIPVAAYFTKSGEGWTISTEPGNAGNFLKVNQWCANPCQTTSSVWTITASDGAYVLSQSEYKGNGNAERVYLGNDAGANTAGAKLFTDQFISNAVKFTIIEKPANEYYFEVPDGFTVTYNGEEYTNADVFIVEGELAAEDFAVNNVPAGYKASVTVDKENNKVIVTFVIDLTAFTDGTKWIFKNKQHQTYMGVNFKGGNLANTVTPSVHKLGSSKNAYDYKNCWEIKMATYKAGEEDPGTSCVQLYNPYYDWYVGKITSRNGAVNMAKNAEWAGCFTLENVNGYIVFKCLNHEAAADNSGNKYYYLHQVDWSDYSVVDWNAEADASQWSCVVVTEAMENEWLTAITSEVADKKPYLEACELGSGIGQYSGIAAADKNAVLEALAIPAEGTIAEKIKAAVYALYPLNALALNMPTAGFYRIKSLNGNDANKAGKYWQIKIKDDASAMEAGADKTINSIVYVKPNADKYNIVSYASGLYLNKYSEVDPVGTEAKAWSFVENTSVVGSYALYASADPHPAYCLSDWAGITYGQKDANAVWTFEPVEALLVEVSDAGYATLYAPVALTLADGVEAYYVSAKSATSATMTQVTGVIPANTAVVLKAAKGTYNLAVASEADAISGNLLTGTLGSEFVAADAYVLSKQEEGIGFYKAKLTKSTNTENDGAEGEEDGTYEAFLNNGFKAYLPASSVSGARFITFDFGTETAIDELKGENGNVKTVIYDLAGRRVQGAQKGIFIVNGKKVIK